MNAGGNGYRDRSLALRAIGALTLGAGVFLGLLAPLETQCFAFFSAGGKFHYEGFGYGSFMFGNIAAQIIGYLVMAALLIPLGYAHCCLRRWAARLAQALVWTWIAIGLPLGAAAMFMLLASKSLSVAAAVAAAVLLALSYAALPFLLLRFYGGKNVTGTLGAADKRSACWVERIPLRVLVLCILFLFYTVVSAALLPFNGLYALFGAFLTGLPGVLALDVTMGCLLVLIHGLLRLKRWAWWGSVVLQGALLLSAVVTFCMRGYDGLLSALAFPEREMEMLAGLPFGGVHFALLAGIPLLAGLCAAALARKDFHAAGK